MAGLICGMHMPFAFITGMDHADFSGLEERIAYTFSDKELLEQAFLHASADAGQSYDRLEFLGDAVLELVISETVFTQKPEFTEGMLTKSRAALVSEVSLAEAARAIGNDALITQADTRLSDLEALGS
jgi:dsRNA-specific ribonuclease